MFRSVKRAFVVALRSPLARVQKAKQRMIREVYGDDDQAPSFMINPL